MTASESVNCFLLNYSYRDFRGHFEITLHAVTADRGPVKIIIDNFRPLFFIPSATPSDLTSRAVERKSLPMKAMDSTPVDCLYFQTYSSLQDCAKELRSHGVSLYESDVHPVERYLMERFVAGGFQANGQSSNQGKTVILHNPQIRGCDIKPDLKVLSLDIETNAASGQIYSIACSGENNAVFIIGTP